MMGSGEYDAYTGRPVYASQKMDKEYDVGVVVGRFQLPELHSGHKQILDSVTSTHKHLLICIGTTDALVTRKDPLDFLIRQGMLLEQYPEAIVLPIADCGSNTQWSAHLDGIIRGVYPTQSIRLYGGKASFIEHYKGMYPTMIIMPLHVDDSASEVRKNVDVSPNNKDFRRGVVYAANHQHPKVWMTVDIALIQEGEPPQLLLGKKTIDGPLVFPGGFVSPEDDSLAIAARRELSEETSIVVNDEPEYIGSYIIENDRYNTEHEKLMTALFLMHYCFGQIQASDDLIDCHWCPITEQLEAYIAPFHKVLYREISSRYLNKS